MNEMLAATVVIFGFVVLVAMIFWVVLETFIPSLPEEAKKRGVLYEEDGDVGYDGPGDHVDNGLDPGVGGGDDDEDGLYQPGGRQWP